MIKVYEERRSSGVGQPEDNYMFNFIRGEIIVYVLEIVEKSCVS